jgi:D-alanine-D-alanine ligase
VSQIAVLFGGPSPEHDVSILLGLPVARALAGSGRDVLAVFWAKTGDFFEVSHELEAADFETGVPRGAEALKLVASRPGGFVKEAGRFGREKPCDVDVVVNCCHGGPGEDGSLQAVFDLAGVAYTGPSAAGAALGMDKLAFGAAVGAAGLPTLARVLLTAEAEIAFDPPYIVKPRFGGSSIGIDLVADADTARARLRANPHLAAGAVVEPYRPDLSDLNIAMRSWPELALSTIERPQRVGESGILAYSDKYVGGRGMEGAARELPANISDELARQVREIAGQVAVICRLRGVARLDFLERDGELYVNELNTVPGSLARYLWTDPPIPLLQQVDALIDEARRSPSTHWTSAGADGTVLRSAGSIAGKLG